MIKEKDVIDNGNSDRVVNWPYVLQQGKVGKMAYAVWCGDRPTIRTLLEEGVNPDVRVRGGDTGLMIAVSDGDFESARMLLESGADVNAYNDDGYTSLMFASLLGYRDLVEVLIEAGADVGARNNYGETSLILTSRAERDMEPKEDPEVYASVIKTLVECGADVNERDEDGWTALETSAYYVSNPSVVEALIKLGAGVNLKDNSGQTALKIARNEGHAQIVKTLIKAGASQIGENYDDGLKESCVNQLEGIKTLVQDYLTGDELKVTEKLLRNVRAIIYSGFPEDREVDVETMGDEEFIKFVLGVTKEVS